MGVPSLAAAALALGASAALTGALHEDGLADVGDGFGGGRDRAAKLAIMRDSRLGTYGAIVLLVGFSARLSALASLPVAAIVPALVVAHALARAAIPVLAANMPFAREDGLGKSAGRPDIASAVTAVVIAVVIALLCLPAKAALLAVVVTVAACGGDGGAGVAADRRRHRRRVRRGRTGRGNRCAGHARRAAVVRHRHERGQSPVADPACAGRGIAGVIHERRCARRHQRCTRRLPRCARNCRRGRPRLPAPASEPWRRRPRWGCGRSPSQISASRISATGPDAAMTISPASSAPPIMISGGRPPNSRPPGGESFAEQIVRVREGLAKLPAGDVDTGGAFRHRARGTWPSRSIWRRSRRCALRSIRCR